MDDPQNLSPQEEIFVSEFVMHYDAARAASKSGLIKEVVFEKHIRVAIKEYSDRDSMPSILTNGYVEAHYMRLGPMLMGDVEVPMVTNGASHDDKLFNGPAMVSMLRDIAKMNEGGPVGTGINPFIVKLAEIDD